MRCAVITTINSPTLAVTALRERDDFRVIVVGDRLTPEPWSCEGVTYLGIHEQLEDYPSLARWLPKDHYSRKVLGYLAALNIGATHILDTDDDNIPDKDLGFPLDKGVWDTLDGDLGFVNVYSLFSDSRAWPRGHPLELVRRDDSGLPATPQYASVGVWQGLVHGDPDVDAIYRLTQGKPVNFHHREPIVLASGTIAPFNSQNTMISTDLFPLLYLPSCISFRFTDILRSFVALPIMWKFGYQLGFVSPNAHHVRNFHNLVVDFQQEIPMYLHGPNVIGATRKAVADSHTIAEALWLAYEALVACQIVPPQELKGVQLWLDAWRETT